jgi:uncharacterized membrane protein (GlpM family)
MKLLVYIVSVCVIVFCAQIARKQPSLGGLIAVMPLTGLLALVGVYIKNPQNFDALTSFTQGALWGIIPSILFFLVAFLCFRKHLPLWIVLSAGFSAWLAAAFVHQWLLHIKR